MHVLHTLDRISQLHITFTFLRCVLGFMAVRLPFVVAALCATSVGVYADGDGLVAMVAGKTEVSHQGPSPARSPAPWYAKWRVS